MPEFTATSLPAAIRQLFELNHYDVQGPLQISGAEIDLVATPRADPLARPIYIEATIEHVDNDKYGKDVGKLAMIASLDPQARRLIVSSKGFSLPVQERAKASRIDTLTYAELFARFERFASYTALLASDSGVGADLRAINTVYEEPSFEDDLGTDQATAFLDSWVTTAASERRWLIVVGEYGTGKTALTKVLQYRWAQRYQSSPSFPIPFRIELRDFSTQFDARGLLHHFLDANRLGDLSLDFVLSLIRAGRIVLLLDGYDEMAQYMLARERRACLEALAHLSADGAKGILTSRPNYFSEAEELQLFEVLYRSLTKPDALPLTPDVQAVVRREKEIDDLLEAHFLSRYERRLRDLSPDQTENLVKRVLAADPVGQDVVLGLLRRVFRTEDEGARVSLSGKPVIISYLLDVVEGLKSQVDDKQPLSEWQVYKLIVDQLMMRDFRRSPLILPQKRLAFLRTLSLWLSRRDTPVISEQPFRDLVRREFQSDLRRALGSGIEQEVERLFADLRGSATLTRTGDGSRDGWKFSHNSLREFLVTQHLLEMLASGASPDYDLPVSSPMRAFVASLDPERVAEHLSHLVRRISQDPTSVGPYFTLLWDAVLRQKSGTSDPHRAALEAIAGNQLDLNSLTLSRITLSSADTPASLQNAKLANSTLTDVRFDHANLDGATFRGAIIDNVSFASASLRGVDFSGAVIVDTNLADADIKGASFERAETDYLAILVDAPDGVSRLQGIAALGYLAYCGARTPEVPHYYLYVHDPRFAIVERIGRRLSEQKWRQRRGLEQSGVARQDPELARAFIAHLEQTGLARTGGRKDLVGLTDSGRDAISLLLLKKTFSAEIHGFFDKHLRRAV